MGTHGVHENQMTLPGGGPTAAAQDATAMVRASSPLVSYKITPRDTSSVQWCRDYCWRDGLLIYDPDWGHTVDQTIIGYDYTAWNGGRAWNIELTLAEREASVLSHALGVTGGQFCKGAGGRSKDRRG